MTRGIATVLLCVLALARAGAHDPINSRVTWETDIARLVQARCVRCHNAAGRAPMPLTTYAEARPWAKAIREEVLTRRMPKWHAARGYGQFANDPSLSAFEIALFVAWVDGGARLRPERPFGGAQGRPKVLEGRSAGGKTPEGGPPSESAWRWDPTRSEKSRPNARTRTVSCGSIPISGTLLAVKPELAHGESAGIAAQVPDGRREIVAWIRDFDPEFVDTYWLRTPLALPRGSRLVVDASPPCRVAITVQ